MREYEPPIEMTNRELLETYSHYSKMSFRLQGDQSYLHVLRLEILDRMDKGTKGQKGHNHHTGEQ